MPPIVPGPDQPEPQQPQIIYVQGTRRAVSGGILDATSTILYVVVAICLGIPLTGCLLTLAFGGLGSLLGGNSDIQPSP